MNVQFVKEIPKGFTHIKGMREPYYGDNNEIIGFWEVSPTESRIVVVRGKEQQLKKYHKQAYEYMQDWLEKQETIVNSAYEGTPGMDDVEHPLGEHVQHIVAWVSRHPVLPVQVKALADKLGEIRVVQITNTYTNHYAVIDAVKALKAEHAVVVLPLSMIAFILDSKEGKGITWLRAEMQPAHEGRCIDHYKEIANDRHNSVVEIQHQCRQFDPSRDVLMPGENVRHLRFREFQVLKSIDLVTEPFTGGDNP